MTLKELREKSGAIGQSIAKDKSIVLGQDVAEVGVSFVQTVAEDSEVYRIRGFKPQK